MPNLPFVGAAGAGVLVLALAGHLWMFDAPGVHRGLEVAAATTASVSQTPLSMSGCASGMSACQVTEPVEPLEALLVLALALVSVVPFVGVTRREDAPPVLPCELAERGPPQLSPVASSVVLLV